MLTGSKFAVVLKGSETMTKRLTVVYLNSTQHLMPGHALHEPVYIRRSSKTAEQFISYE